MNRPYDYVDFGYRGLPSIHHSAYMRPLAFLLGHYESELRIHTGQFLLNDFDFCKSLAILCAGSS